MPMEELLEELVLHLAFKLQNKNKNSTYIHTVNCMLLGKYKVALLQQVVVKKTQLF